MRTNAASLPAAALLLVFAAGPRAARAEETAPPDPAHALERGVRWLQARAMDGIWFMDVGDQKVPSPGFTAVALAPVAASLPKEKRRDDPAIRKSVAFLLSLQQPDGRLSAPGLEGYENYVTSATLMALAIIDDPSHAGARAKMRDYVLSIQRRDEGRHEGGFGYNKQQGADLSNAQYAIEALRAAGIPEDHEAMIAARKYLSRLQNRSENADNDGAKWVVDHEGYGKVTVVPGNDGSAGYEPGVSKAGLVKLPDGTFVARGYGSMTYALLKCYLLAGVKGDDPRVKAALDWLGKHYQWEKNPGFEDLAKEDPKRKDAPYFGLYYYYMTAAKALALAGVDKLETPDGPRDWRADLGKTIAALQREDGSWVNGKSPRWEEDDPVLVTAYATHALQAILGVAK